MNPSDDDPVLVAVRRAVELRGVEFKESQPFETLRYKIVKTAMGMANLRDGGLIIIGPHQREGRLIASGIAQEHEDSYDPDDVIEAINRHARPPVNCSVRIVPEADGRRFVGIEIRSFDRSPVFCKRNTPDDINRDDRLVEGSLYARSNDRIGTTRVVDPDLMAEILEIAAERRAAEIIQLSQRVGFTMPNAGRDALQARLLDTLDAPTADSVIDIIEDLSRQSPADSTSAFRRERRSFEAND